MRSPLWFVVAGLVAAGGLASAWFYVIPRIAAFTGGLQQVVMPGPAFVTLDRTGPYTIFAEVNSVVDGRLYDAPPPSGVRLTVTSEATGNSVPLAAPTASVDYSIGARKGHAVLGFTIDLPGRYRLASDKTVGGDYVIAVARGSAMGSISELFRTTVIGVCLGIAGLGIAALIVATTIIQRGKAKKMAG
jgi:hypothetical protein